ncbi:jumonji domain containing 5 [Metarhizium album ARSEF 1941]|uniref:Jumonji domain containing 5 n=1 Tax=Metarhizium album (strain ARSEF 1941) TaxID=1081103 RepID=A0A0B2WM22_METAS|nr:jumonji domain containing 5 [Metarhizium album ARSEF 1941]KHN94065.1 jumonji domain containing 5 [Metarhizium album ARSEF 1941]
MAPRDEILSWYRAAAETLISTPTKDDPDPESTALNDLLQRQAKSLLAMHDAVKGCTPRRANESLLTRRLGDLIAISTSRFYAYRFDLLPYPWRQIHTDALILSTFHDILCYLGQSTWLDDQALDGVVEKLDRAVITAGGAGVLGAAWIERTLRLVERLCDAAQGDGEPEAPARRARRARRADAFFPPEEPYTRPALSPARTCPARRGWSLDTFEKYMNGDSPPRPVLFTDLVTTWPALTERPWKSPSYLLSRTFGGRRLVPVELGRSYVDAGWGQELVPFKTFLSRYVSPGAAGEVGYLAQHDLFGQIPCLRGDISIPDLCWSSVPLHPTDPAKNKARLRVPLVNAWFGPARTITPLHTDAYHNLLVQVVGTKYVRLYPPWSKAMRPRGEEAGVDMSNTSLLDLGVVEGWDDDQDSQGMTLEEREAARRELAAEEYWECVLGEGDTLLIPMGWWHYVRSLSVSFSVSFWWN